MSQSNLWITALASEPQLSLIEDRERVFLPAMEWLRSAFSMCPNEWVNWLSSGQAESRRRSATLKRLVPFGLRVRNEIVCAQCKNRGFGACRRFFGIVHESLSC